MMNKHKTTRRDFFKTALGAAATPYILTSAALGTADAAPAGERAVLGHIGVGGRGGALLRGFLGIKECQSVAVADPFEARRNGWAERINKRAGKQVCKAYRDLRELLDRKDIDGVVVATPDHWHVPAGILAAKAGKDMYVEKPLSVCVNWNIAMRKAVHRYGRMFQYGTQQRSSRHLRHACELVHNGYVGKVHTIEVVAPGGSSGGSTKPIPVPEGFDYDLWLGPAPVSPYTKDRCTRGGSWFVYDNSIGFLGGWGAHPLDIALWGWDDETSVPVEIEGTGTIPTKGLFDTVKDWKIRGRYANGMKFKFTHGSNLTTFIGDKGKVAVSRGGLRTEPKELKQEKIKPDGVHLVESNSHGYNFVKSIKTRVKPVSNIEDAVQSDTISHLSDIAIRTGRKIKWDPAKEKIIGDEQASRMLNRAMRSPWTL